MNKFVIVINGAGGVGKDTFVSLVSKHYPTVNYSSAILAKKIATYAGWNGTKEEKDRNFLSDIKDAITKWNDLPFKDMCQNIDNFLYNDKDHQFMFLHIREPQEIRRIVDKYNCKSLLITNKNIETKYSNHADNDVYKYYYDCKIENDGSLLYLESSALNYCYRLIHNM